MTLFESESEESRRNLSDIPNYLLGDELWLGYVAEEEQE